MSNQQVSNTPINPLVALASLPQPQVVSGTLGEQGNPISYQDVRDFPIIMDSDLISNVDFIDRIPISISLSAGTHLWSVQTPVMKRSINDNYPLDQFINWSHYPMLTHYYWDSKQQLGFTFIGPQAITGKLLITYDPSFLTSFASSRYRFDRRKITTEWDLSKEKTKWVEVEGFKLDEKRSITHWNIAANSTTGFEFARQSLHDFSCNLGSITVTIIQPIQAVTLYPSSFTILVFASNSGSMFYTPTDPRRFQKDLVTPYRNYDKINRS